MQGALLLYIHITFKPLEGIIFPLPITPPVSVRKKIVWPGEAVIYIPPSQSWNGDLIAVYKIGTVVCVRVCFDVVSCIDMKGYNNNLAPVKSQYNG